MSTSVKTIAVIGGGPAGLIAAETLARVGSENKLLALGYVAGLFFALPALMMVAAK